MDSLDYWRLCDELTVIQASLLIVGEDPGDTSEEYVLEWEYHNRPKGFNAVYAALKSAISSKRINAKIIHSVEQVESSYDGDHRSDWIRESTPNWLLTTIEVHDLKNWLLHRGIKTGFFFPQGIEDRNYLDPNNPFYAPKLAAAVKSWEEITANNRLLSNKTPKQALEKWLRENASAYGLSKDDGTHNQQGIDQIAKVANWKPEGGASKTPTQGSKIPPTPHASSVIQGLQGEQLSTEDLEEEIPF